MIRSSLFLMSGMVISWFGLSGTTRAESFSGVADFDRWMYAFNGSPGSRVTAPTFGAIGSPAFDNLDGQFVLGFDTTRLDSEGAEGVPPGKSLYQYHILSARVELTHFIGSFLYDPTQDGFETFLDPSDPDYLEDPDVGRPIELYGVRYRSPFKYGEFEPATPGDTGFAETDDFEQMPEDGVFARVRNAFPFAFDAPDYNTEDHETGDVSNYVTDRFTPKPFAVGQSASGLAPGDPVPEGSGGSSAGETFQFDVDLSDGQNRTYLQQGLSDGGLFFAATSFHATDQGGGQNPNFYTSNSFDPMALPPTLYLEVEILPDPGDMNGDGVVDAGDVNPMVLALTNRIAFEAAYQNVDADLVGDLDESGSLDLGDLAQFVHRITSSTNSQSAANSAPEPSSIIFLISTLVTMVVSRGRHTGRRNTCKS